MAVEMSTRAYELRKELGDKRSIVSSLLELGLIYESMDSTEMALQKMRLGRFYCKASKRSGNAGRIGA
jgi:hypothetical protein